MMHVEDIMSTVGVFSIMGDIMSTIGAYHDACGDIMSTMGVFSTMWDIMSTMGCSVPWGIS